MHNQQPATGEEDFADELAQVVPAHVQPVALKTSFFPWHKPRKNWVRVTQWNAEAERLIERLGLARAGRPLSYVSLPGPDLLDVRSLHTVCERKQVALKFTGFMGDERDQTELHISMGEVLARPGVDGRSFVFRDSLQSLGVLRSIGERTVTEFAPFDIVNIDLCNSIAGAPPLDQQEGCYDAIARIIELQRVGRAPAEPWLLFITTRANAEKVDRRAGAALFGALRENCVRHAEVAESSLRELQLDVEALDRLVRGERVPNISFELSFAASVSKWILMLIDRGTPRGTIQLLPTSCTYGVRFPGGADMLSLGFECRTLVEHPNDAVGLARGAANGQPQPTEAQAASELLRVIPAMRNVDQMLSDPHEYGLQLESAANAMKDARFDRRAYVEWAMKQREAPDAHPQRELGRTEAAPTSVFGSKLLEALRGEKK